MFCIFPFRCGFRSTTSTGQRCFSAQYSKVYQSRQLFDLVEELNIPNGAGPHFRGGYTGTGRVVVANNTYHEEEFTGERNAGHLAEWDGKAWTIISDQPFIEVSGKHEWGESEYGDPIHALF